MTSPRSNGKSRLSGRWMIWDWQVGINISRTGDHEYSLSQAKYAEAILERFNMTNCKPAATPLSPGHKLYQSTDEELNEIKSEKIPYRNTVGSLMYLSQCTRPDLTHAVGVLSQHLEKPSAQHWDAVTHVLRYLRGTTNLGIVYRGSSQATIHGLESSTCPISHCDADWAGDRSTRRSTTGYIFQLAGGPISWRSRLQPTVALSSTEAEYRAVTEAGQELLWLRRMMEKFGFSDSSPTVLMSDSLGAIHLTSKSIFHGRTKHVEIQYHWIREVVNAGHLSIKHCPTDVMVSDLLTKALSKAQFVKLRSMMGLTDASTPKT